MIFSYDKLTCICLVVTELILILKLCSSTRFESDLKIESRPSFKQEVADFELWLKEKIKDSETHSGENPFETEHQSSHNEPNYEDYHELSSFEEVPGDEMLENSDFKKFLLDTKDDEKELSSEMRPSRNEELVHEKHLQESQVNEEIPFHDLLEQLSSKNEFPHQQNSEHSVIPPHINSERYPVEEILYIRRSDSELSDSVPDVIDALMPDERTKKEESESQHEEERQNYSMHEYISRKAEDNIFFKDTCSVYNHSFSNQQVCSSRQQYEIETHFSKNYLESLRMAFEKKPLKLHPEDSMCNYRKDLGPDRGVEERALCPFEWTVTERNPARIPEYLLTAKCSCQISRKVRHQRAKCVEVKTKVPVLWRTGCKDGSHIYQEGWEEIVAACVPLGRDVEFHGQGNYFKIDSPE